MNNQYQWIVFDFDGTLVDSVPIMYRVYSKFIKSKGLNPSKTEFEKLNGPTLREIVSYLKKKHHIKKDAATLIQQYEKIINSEYLENVKLFEGRADLLRSLKKNKFKIGLVTSAKQELVYPFLVKNKIENLFDKIVYGDKIQHSKPHPEIYSKFLSEVNSNSVLVLEDSENGIKSAKSAGLECLNVTGKSSYDIMHNLVKN